MFLFFLHFVGLLFHRVILMSGSALSPIAVGSLGLAKGRELAKRFGTAVKCPHEPPSEMLNCLRQTPLEDFLESDVRLERKRHTAVIEQTSFFFFIKLSLLL